MGERGDRLWVGEPGRLSPEDSERLREEKLLLVCRRGEGCMVKRRSSDRRLWHRREGDPAARLKAKVLEIMPYVGPSL